MISPTALGLPAKFTSFRQYPSGRTQLDTVSDLLNVSTRFTKFYAETGAGKSAIYMLASILREERVLILTPTIALQDQLINDFSSVGLVNIKGKSHYECLALNPGGEFYAGTRGSCTVGVTLCNHGRRCSHRNQCYYFAATDEAKKRKLVQTNYAKWMSSPPDAFGDFDTIICDEVQKAPGILESFCTVEVNEKWLRSSLRIELPPNDISTWCREALDVAQLEREQQRNPIERLLLTQFISGMDRLTSTGTDWIRESTSAGVKFTPVWVNNFAEPLLYRGIKRVILVSATIDDKLLTYLGVPKPLTTSVSVEGIFSPTRRPIISFSSRGPMAPQMIKKKSNMVDSELATWVKQADRIIESRSGRYALKGLIQSVSYDWAEEIYERSEMRGFMIMHGKRNAEEVISEFMASTTPSVLVSPVIGEGRDFKYSIARYQIVSKLPLVYMGTELMKARLKEDADYHNWLVAHKLTQMFGRLMRVVDDGGETFIIDGQWEKWFRRKATWTPWVEKAFRVDHEIAPLLEEW